MFMFYVAFKRVGFCDHIKSIEINEEIIINDIVFGESVSCQLL